MTQTLGCHFHYCSKCQTNPDKQEDERKRKRLLLLQITLIDTILAGYRQKLIYINQSILVNGKHSRKMSMYPNQSFSNLMESH